MFDFTSLYHSEHAAKIYERRGRRLLATVVGDSLLEVRVSLILKCSLSCILIIMLYYPVPLWEFSEIMKQSLTNKLK